MADAGDTFPVLLDPDGLAPAEYDVWSIPRQVIVDAAGEVRFDRIGLNAIEDLDHHAIISALLAELEPRRPPRPGPDQPRLCLAQCVYLLICLNRSGFRPPSSTDASG